jgi:hypothetical protein
LVVSQYAIDDIAGKKNSATFFQDESVCFSAKVSILPTPYLNINTTASPLHNAR